VERCIRQARAALPAGAWTLRHASGWTPLEQQAVREELTRRLGVEPQLRSDATIEAGLIIDSGGACLDASLGGLLADRSRLEARLLALLAAENPT
jgi:F0F1-type ATP synthase delta subunit